MRDRKPLILLMLLMGCSAPTALKVDNLVFLTRGGCVNTDIMRANLDSALKRVNRPATYQFIDLDTLPKTDPRTGYPTPTILYANHDLFGLPQPTPPFPDPT